MHKKENEREIIFLVSENPLLLDNCYRAFQRPPTRNIYCMSYYKMRDNDYMGYI